MLIFRVERVEIAKTIMKGKGNIIYMTKLFLILQGLPTFVNIQLNRHDLAVTDAKEALKLDPDYSKAFARMGFAYLSMSNLKEAEECYMNALRLDANNQSYKDNLDAVREKMSTGPTNPQGKSKPCYYYVKFEYSLLVSYGRQ